MTSSRQLQTLDDLREYVYRILCQTHELEHNAFPMTQRLLVKGGAPCGVHFCLHGPRAVKFSAIWDALCNAILFYGPKGERFQKTELIESPPLESIVA